MKKSSLSFFLLMVLLSPITSAQDKIYKTDNSVVDAKIIEVGAKEIKYKSYSNIEGPTYVVDKSEVAIIVYQNGQHDVFSNVPKEVSSTANVVSFDSLKKSIIAINLFDIVFTNLTVSYEYLFKSGGIGVKIPFSLGLKEASGNSGSYYYDSRNNFNQNKIYSTGIDINFYPNKQRRKVNYYVGPSLQYGVFNYKYYTYTGWWNYSPEVIRGQHYAVLLNNGIRFSPAKNMTMSFQLGLGFKQSVTKYDDYIYPSASGGFNVGFIF